MPSTKAKSELPTTDGEARARIIGGARKHFFAHGFRNVTMDDIARELGMSKKTLYAHFGSKPDLLEAAIQDKLESFDANLAAVETKYDGDFESTLREFLLCMQRQTAEISPPFVRDMQSVALDLWNKVQARRAEILERYFGKLFREGRKSGLIRSDLSPKLIMEVLLGLIQGILNPQKVTELNLTPQSALSQTLSIVLNGVIDPERAPKR